MIEIEQAGKVYDDMSEEERETLAENVAESMMFLENDTRKTVLSYFYEVSQELGRKIEKRLSF